MINYNSSNIGKSEVMAFHQEVNRVLHPARSGFLKARQTHENRRAYTELFDAIKNGALNETASKVLENRTKLIEDAIDKRTLRLTNPNPPSLHVAKRLRTANVIDQRTLDIIKRTLKGYVT